MDSNDKVRDDRIRYGGAKHMKKNMGNRKFEFVFIFLKGLLMGMADIIPGVSGGTMALITGIYERLINAIGNVNLWFAVDYFRYLFKKKKSFLDKAQKNIARIDLLFLVVLGLGIAIALGIGSKVIPYFMDNYTAFIYAFFFGLILASVRVIAMRKKRELKFRDIIMGAIGLGLGFIVVSIPALQANHSLLMIFFSGMIAICAMILPGISGSFILLILGQYKFMLNVLHNLQERYMFFLSFAIGAAIGLLGFSRLISWLLKRYHDEVIMFLVGLMLGSLKLPFNIVFMDGNLIFSLWNIILVLIFLIAGAVIVTLLGRYDLKKERMKKSKE